MKTSNNIFSLEQIAEDFDQDVQTILITLLEHRMLFITPEGSLIINTHHQEYVYLIELNNTIYVTPKGRQKIQDLLKQNDVLNKQNIEILIKAQGQHNTDLIINEELAELTKAFTKYRRYQIDPELASEKDEVNLRQNLIEEIADVQICIEMLKQIFELKQSEINLTIDVKMMRNLNRI